MLEGGIAARPENVLIYATSNRRHLMPRQVGENQYPQNRRRRVVSARDDRREGFAQRSIRAATRLLSILSTHLPTDCLPLRPKAWFVPPDEGAPSEGVGVGSVVEWQIGTGRPSICR